MGWVLEFRHEASLLTNVSHISTIFPSYRRCSTKLPNADAAASRTSACWCWSCSTSDGIMSRIVSTSWAKIPNQLRCDNIRCSSRFWANRTIADRTSWALVNWVSESRPSTPLTNDTTVTLITALSSSMCPNQYSNIPSRSNSPCLAVFAMVEEAANRTSECWSLSDLINDGIATLIESWSSATNLD